LYYIAGKRLCHAYPAAGIAFEYAKRTAFENPPL
jgi:hypothetical protein